MNAQADALHPVIDAWPWSLSSAWRSHSYHVDLRKSDSQSGGEDSRRIRRKARTQPETSPTGFANRTEGNQAWPASSLFKTSSLSFNPRFRNTLSSLCEIKRTISKQSWISKRQDSEGTSNPALGTLIKKFLESTSPCTAIALVSKLVHCGKSCSNDLYHLKCCTVDPRPSARKGRGSAPLCHLSWEKRAGRPFWLNRYHHAM